MAHRTDVIQVHQNFPSKGSTGTVVDPFCGKEITQREARSVLFEAKDTLYFCSKDCREKYLTLKKRSLRAA